jgi:hypothetical protein
MEKRRRHVVELFDRTFAARPSEREVKMAAQKAMIEQRCPKRATRRCRPDKRAILRSIAG